MGRDASRDGEAAADAFRYCATAAESSSKAGGGKAPSSPAGCGGSSPTTALASSVLAPHRAKEIQAVRGQMACPYTARMYSRPFASRLSSNLCFSLACTIWCKSASVALNLLTWCKASTSPTATKPSVRMFKPRSVAVYRKIADRALEMRTSLVSARLPPAPLPRSPIEPRRSASSALRRRVNSSSCTIFMEWPCTARMYAWPSASRFNSNLCLSLACTICCKSASMALNLLT
mmetsp:Transcript_51205/g.129250  ORF Transcript_51205/g.129250 Transcript_51205/m.129250 type:complete len:233 (+) Transcript_51205:144-842(+)